MSAKLNVNSLCNFLQDMDLICKKTQWSINFYVYIKVYILGQVYYIVFINDINRDLLVDGMLFFIFWGYEFIPDFDKPEMDL